MGQFAGAISNAVGNAGVPVGQTTQGIKQSLEKDANQTNLNRTAAQEAALRDDLRRQGLSPEEIEEALSNRGVTDPSIATKNVADLTDKTIETGDPGKQIVVSSFLTALTEGRLSEAKDRLIEAAQEQIDRVARVIRKWWEFDTSQIRTTPPSADAVRYRNRPEIQIHSIRDAEGIGALQSSGSLLGSYSGFLLTSVSVSDVEKVDIIETFGAPHIFASGTFVKKVMLSGFVRAYPVVDANTGTWADPELRAADYVKFRNFYEDYLRTTRMAEAGTIARLVVDHETYEGFFTNLNINRDAQMEQIIPWSASMIVTRHVHRDDPVADQYLASRIKKIDTEEQALDADNAWAEATDAEGTMNIYASKDIRTAEGEGKAASITTGVLSADRPHVAQEGAQPTPALFARGIGSGGVTVRVDNDIKGIQLVALPPGKTDPADGKDLRGVTFSGSSAANAVGITYEVTNYYALLDSVLAAGAEESDKKVTASVRFTVQSELPNDNQPVVVTVNLTLSTEQGYSVYGKLFVGPAYKERVLTVATSATSATQTLEALLNQDKSNDIYDASGKVDVRVEFTLTEPGQSTKPLKLSKDSFQPGDLKFTAFKVVPSLRKEAAQSPPKSDTVDPAKDTALVQAASGPTNPKWQGGVVSPTTPEAVDVSRLEDGVLRFDTSIQLATEQDGEAINWSNASPFLYHRFWLWDITATLALRGLEEKTVKLHLAANAEGEAGTLFDQVVAIVPRGSLGSGLVSLPAGVLPFSDPKVNFITVTPSGSFVAQFDIILRDPAVGLPPALVAELQKLSFRANYTTGKGEYTSLGLGSSVTGDRSLNTPVASAERSGYTVRWGQPFAPSVVAETRTLSVEFRPTTTEFNGGGAQAQRTVTQQNRLVHAAEALGDFATSIQWFMGAATLKPLPTVKGGVEVGG